MTDASFSNIALSTLAAARQTVARFATADGSEEKGARSSAFIDEGGGQNQTAQLLSALSSHASVPPSALAARQRTRCGQADRQLKLLQRETSEALSLSPGRGKYGTECACGGSRPSKAIQVLGKNKNPSVPCVIENPCTHPDTVSPQGASWQAIARAGNGWGLKASSYPIRMHNLVPSAMPLPPRD